MTTKVKLAYVGYTDGKADVLYLEDQGCAVELLLGNCKFLVRVAQLWRPGNGAYWNSTMVWLVSRGFH